MDRNTKKHVIIVAGGTGQRMGIETPKQFLLVRGTPILMHTINVFYQYDRAINIVVVLPENQIYYWEKLCHENDFSIKHTIVKGGETRFHSVKNGLDEIQEEGFIAIHDGVRPLVNKLTIGRCFETAEKLGNAVPVISPVDSIRVGDSNRNYPVDRSTVKQVQTPQVYESKLIKSAYGQEFSPEFTDDASVLEKMGVIINLVEGNPENIKITMPVDILLAEAFMKRVQNGY